MSVLLNNEYGSFEVPISSIEQDATTLLEVAGKKQYEVSILITTDEGIRDINATWRQKDKATNVLSFPLNDKDDSLHPMLGDIIISIDTAKREATTKQHSLQNYTRRLLVHGFVHLLGYDHEASDEAYDEMRAVEKDFLQKLQIQENHND